jgi:thymidylate synthase (FAD)
MSDSPGITFRSDMTVQLVKHTASDHDVIFAARVSTLGDRSLETRARQLVEHLGVPDTPAKDKEKGLINYLMRDRHGSPFEHNSMTFFISAPIFVFREFMRHRVGWSYNEESGRYRELDPVFYVPDTERKLVQVGKAGAYTFEHGTPEQYEELVNSLEFSYELAYLGYTKMLEEGIAREVARAVLPVGIYSSMYATCNARSLMHFLGLRTQHELAKVPSFPQREIEMVAERMEEEWARLMPHTYEAFNKNGRVAP